MATLRFPVAIWEDHDGCFTAQPLAGEASAATDKTAGGAMDQVKKYLGWLVQESSAQAQTELLDPELAYFTVAVRPLYRTEQGEFPAEQTVPIRAACVVGRRRDNSLTCWLPTLDIVFHCCGREAVERFVADYVRQKLNGLPPRELSRFLLPKSIHLNFVAVRVRPREPSRGETEWPALKAVAEPLGDRALRKRWPQAWLRDREVADLTERLQARRASLLLVGPSGVGKTTVLATAVRKIERPCGAKPSERQDSAPHQTGHRFWFTSGARLIAGMQYLGQWEERCEQVIEELAEIGGVLCVDSLIGLIRAGGGTADSSLAAFFVPYLESGELRLVAETTASGLDACRRLLPGFDSLFQIVPIDELDRGAAHALLDRLTSALEQNHHLPCEPGVADWVHRLFRRFLPYQTFPGRCAGFVRALFEHAETHRIVRVTGEQVMQQFIQQTGLPEFLLRDEIPLNPDDVLAAFQQKIYGQDEACEAAARLVTTFKAGLNDPNRPIGVQIYCGPTGVGKTELAKALAAYLFGSGRWQDRLVRLDMSEYAGYGAADRLLTQPDGGPSDLIKKVRAQPFVVVLLDEIEKAAPEVFDVLLGLLDEGRLTDRFGGTTTFCSAVVILTSNLGADAAKTIGFEKSGLPSYEREVMSFFRPEFFNRLDEVVVFRPLSAETIQKITRKELREIAAREGFTRAGLKLGWMEAVEQLMARKGFDPRYGARPLQRTLEREVVAPLARWLAENPHVQNASIQLDVDRQERVVVKTLIQ